MHNYLEQTLPCKILSRTKLGQSTAEYAILIAVVVAAVVAMQTYTQRSLQARMRDASQYLTKTTSNLGNTDQYEPYYQKSDYNTTKDSADSKILTPGTVASTSATNRTRSGSQESSYGNDSH